MISSFQPYKGLILLLTSCFIWIGGISLAFVFFLGTAVTTGWIIAGGLLLALAVWIVIMAGEIRHAIELPECYSTGNSERDPREADADFQFEISGVKTTAAHSKKPFQAGERATSRSRGRSRRGIALPARPAAGR